MTSSDPNLYAAPSLEAEPGVVAQKRQSTGLFLAAFVLASIIALIAITRGIIAIFGEAAIRNLNGVLLVSLVLVACIARVAVKRYWTVPRDVRAVITAALLVAIASLLALVLNDAGKIQLF